jgi:hypothetical protein
VLIPEQGTVQEEDQEQASEAAIEDLPAAPAIEGKPWFICITILLYATLLHLMLVGLYCALKCSVGVSRPGGPWADEWNVAACPSPDGSTRDGARRGEERAAGAREGGGNPAAFVFLSRAQVGCACSRGLQTSTRERGASGLARAPVPSSSPRGQPSIRGPWSFLL